MIFGTTSVPIQTIFRYATCMWYAKHRVARLGYEVHRREFGPHHSVGICPKVGLIEIYDNLSISCSSISFEEFDLLSRNQIRRNFGKMCQFTDANVPFPLCRSPCQGRPNRG